MRNVIEIIHTLHLYHPRDVVACQHGNMTLATKLKSPSVAMNVTTLTMTPKGLGASQMPRALIHRLTVQIHLDTVKQQHRPL
jgi:hypothetical protein